jgi:transposase
MEDRMYYRSQSFKVPAETVRVAQAAFPQGNNYMTMRDQINQIYTNSQFTHLFSHAGRSAEAPGRLALVLVMQYAEGLSDRQAAEAVRSRIDWKYALALPLEDAGFVHGILSQFRERLIAGGEEMLLLEDMLMRFNDLGLLSSRGKQRTDSTHILAATRQLNRLELVGETMRQALEILATAYPNWLRQHLQPDWFDRYGARFEEYRLPKTVKQREELAESIGQDGLYLMEQLLAYPITTSSYELPAITTLSCIWRQQYYYDVEGCLRWRGKEQGFPPGAKLIQTPHDLEARYSRKRDTEWTGYKVHLTETCDPETPNLITHVETTLATVPDSEALSQIHNRLLDKNCAPQTHLVDAGYIDADNLVNSAIDNIDLIGPALADTSWQGRDPDAFDLSAFTIDWEAQRVTCPEGKQSHIWSHSKNSFDAPVIHVRFARNDCAACAQRVRCTRADKNPRSLKLYPQEQHTALQMARKRQETAIFQEEYKKRAGVEGTISQGTRSFDLRRTRYIGLAKTHLHNVLVAAAMNLTRVISWLRDKPRAQTRVSALASLALA